jgi:cephalosporin hydroxylase
MDEKQVRYLHTQNMKNHKKIYTSKKGYEIKCVHEDDCFQIIGQIVDDFEPELIIELGFSWGGMTKLFEDYSKAEIHAFNKRCKRIPDESLFGKRVTFHWNDILSKQLDKLVELCKDSRKKILYCDNGDKIKEVYMYGQYLNKGDMIGAHDYPREIYEDYNLLLENIKKKVTPKDVEKMNKVLEDFEPAYHDLFLKMNFSDRFWVKVK